jgi:catechol 2,3-dioxygenase-like lactoylglutathione lyase family enzyme
MRSLCHVNLQARQVKAMVAWYSDLLGLRFGPSPDFPFPGAWLYASDDDVSALVEHDGDPAVGSEEKLKLEQFASPQQERQISRRD